MKIVKIQRRKTSDTVITIPEQYASEIEGDYLQVDRDENGRLIYTEV